MRPTLASIRKYVNFIYFNLRKPSLSKSSLQLMPPSYYSVFLSVFFLWFPKPVTNLSVIQFLQVILPSNLDSYLFIMRYNWFSQNLFIPYFYFLTLFLLLFLSIILRVLISVIRHSTPYNNIGVRMFRKKPSLPVEEHSPFRLMGFIYLFLSFLLIQNVVS